jgi:hypothetical protein
MITVAAGPKIAGFTFQFQRALYRLFASEVNATIGIETDDDVVELRYLPDGTVEAVFEQDKHSIKDTGQPFQDGSKNLWHTLHVWLVAMSSMRQAHEHICYCLVTNKAVPADAFARKLSEASEPTEIQACIKEIRERAADAESEAAVSLKAVAGFADEDLSFLIANLALMDEYGTASGIAPRDATIQLLQLPPDLEAKGADIYSSLLGQLVQACQDAWLGKKPFWIAKAPFAMRLQSEIAAHRMERYVERDFVSTQYKEYLKNDKKSHLFLRQLQHLGIPVAQCDRALEHYWAFYAERVRLWSEGDVLPSAWDSRNGHLHQRWQMITDSIALEEPPGTQEEVLAKKVLAKTLNGDFTAKLGDHDTKQPYFTSGNYHDLANQPQHACFVHWHTSFAPKKGGEGE